jgi:hypothetical protein
MSNNNSKKVPVSSLGLGDKIQLWDDDGYGTATVTQVKDQIVLAQRPYIHTADFSYTGGVLWYIGMETVSMYASDTRHVTLVRKGDPLK